MALSLCSPLCVSSAKVIEKGKIPMIIEFSGEHTGSVLMFGKVATDLLKMMGQSGNDEGAISAPDVSSALEKLKASLSRVPEDESDNDDDIEEKEVSLQTRAVPLINLLEKSAASGGYVMWKPQ